MTDARETLMTDPDTMPATGRSGLLRLILIVLALAGLAVAAWLGWLRFQQQAREPDLAGPITARTLNGTWAWFGPENCKDFYLTISFAGDRIYVRQDGAPAVDLSGAKMEKLDISIAPTVAVSYELGDNKYESQYRFENVNEIVLVDDLVNGKNNQAIDKGRGKKLVRCPKNDPMPAIGADAADGA
jgi:hypothetical protein